MDFNDIRDNWALVAAVTLIAIVTIPVTAHLYRRSARGQLRARVSDAADKRHELQKAGRKTHKAEQRLRKLAQKADQTRPRLLQEAKDVLADARALEKVAHDQVLIAENHLRRVIHEEYPPSKHASMRARYLPSDPSDDKPFSF